MSVSLLTVFASSTLLFVSWALLCHVEDRRGRRLLAPHLRTQLDIVTLRVAASVGRRTQYVGRYLITLSWYYSLHALLRTFLRFTARVYEVAERVFERNRARAKQLRKERRRLTHLTHIAEHKSATQLTPDEQVALKKRMLEQE